MPTEAELVSVRAVAEQHRVKLNSLVQQRAKKMHWLATSNDVDLIAAFQQDVRGLADQIADLLGVIDGLGLEIGLRGDVILPRDLVFIRGAPSNEQPAADSPSASAPPAPPPEPPTDVYEPARAKTRAIICALLFLPPSKEELMEITRVLKEHEPTWDQLTPELMKGIVGYTAARLHVLQQALPDDQMVRRNFVSLRTLQEKYKPGFVHGLKTEHRAPNGITWNNESVARWHRLAKLLAPFPAASAQHVNAVGVQLSNYQVAGNRPTKEKVTDGIINAFRLAIRDGIAPTHPEIVELFRAHLSDEQFQELPHSLTDLIRPL